MRPVEEAGDTRAVGCRHGVRGQAAWAPVSVGQAVASRSLERPLLVCAPALPLALVAASAIGAGASVYSARKAAKGQKKAMKQAEKDAADTKAANERAINQANQKTPDLASIFGMNKGLTGGGIGSTMLTGPGGVAAGSLSLGRNTLLGQ